MKAARGERHVLAERTVAVALRDGGTRRLSGERVIVRVGTRATLPISAVQRTRTLSEPRGFMKMLDAGSDRILGFTAFGAEASGLLAVVQTAMPGRLPFTVPRDALFAHPTAAEGLTALLANVPDAPRPEPSGR